MGTWARWAIFIAPNFSTSALISLVADAASRTAMRKFPSHPANFSAVIPATAAATAESDAFSASAFPESIRNA